MTDGHHIDPPTQLRRRQQPNQQLSQASDSEHHSIRTQEKKGRHTRRENNYEGRIVRGWAEREGGEKLRQLTRDITPRGSGPEVRRGRLLWEVFYYGAVVATIPAVAGTL